MKNSSEQCSMLNLQQSYQSYVYCISLSLFKDCIYLFLDRGEGREKEREKNIEVSLPLARPLQGTWPATQACALTGDRTSVCRPALSPLSHTGQGMFTASPDGIIFSCTWFNFVVFCSSWLLSVQNPPLTSPARSHIKQLTWQQN